MVQAGPTIMKTIKIVSLIFLIGWVTGCQTLEGEREGNLYHSPGAAYSVDLSINTFRGEVLLDERCDQLGGSTTFWDGSGRMFRVDYLRIEDNPRLRAPRFASDLTLLNLALNTYLRQIVAPSEVITSVEAAHREFLQDASPRALFAVVSLEVDHTLTDGLPPVSGAHYYGFLLFKQGELLYIIQHRQPVFMPEKMKSVLQRIASNMTIPGRDRDNNEMERLRQLLARMAPRNERLQRPVRLCRQEQEADQAQEAPEEG